MLLCERLQKRKVDARRSLTSGARVAAAIILKESLSDVSTVTCPTCFWNGEWRSFY